MVNVLTSIRQDIAQALVTGGVPAKTWVPANLFYPLALVSPAADYVSTPIGDNPFSKRHSVSVQVLLLAGTGMDEQSVEKADDLIVNAVDALDDWDVTDVSAPFEFRTTEGNTYTAAMLTINTNTNLERIDD